MAKKIFRQEKWLKKSLGEGRPLVCTLLTLASILYRWAVYIRNSAYARKILPIKTVPVPVISVGAVTCGGTRKTPLVIHLAKEMGRGAGILTSGYAAEQKAGIKEVGSSLEGDEPYLILQKLPEAHVYADKNRYACAKAAVKKGVRYLILDGGLQHRSLHRDVEIVTIDAQNPFGKDLFLPRGFLRDDPKRILDADWIVVMDSKEEKKFQEVVREIQKRGGKAPVIGMRAKIAYPEKIRGKRVGVFCGLGNPEQFLQMLQEENAEIVCREVLSDHESFLDLSTFLSKTVSLGGDIVVCTEKDYVKLPCEMQKCVSPLEMVLTVEFGQDAYEEMLRLLKKNT